jgi:hypothetical protein
MFGELALDETKEGHVGYNNDDDHMCADEKRKRKATWRVPNK